MYVQYEKLYNVNNNDYEDDEDDDNDDDKDDMMMMPKGMLCTFNITYIQKVYITSNIYSQK